MPTYINKNGSNVEVTPATNVYARTDASFSRVNYIYVRQDAAWTQVYQYDNTAPTIRDWTVSGNDNNEMRINWSAGGSIVTDSESGVASVNLEYQYTPFGGSGEGWISWFGMSGAQWSATSGDFGFVFSNTKRPTQNTGALPYTWSNRYYVDFRVTATDVVGNVTVKTMGNGQLTRPIGDVLIVPAVSGDSFRTGIGWYGLTAHGCRSGVSPEPLDWAYGAWFYGSGVSDFHIVKNASANRYQANSGNLYAQRYQSQGVSGTWAWQQHDLTFSSGTTGANFVGNIVTASISGTDAAATLTLDSGHLLNFANLSAKGFGAVRNGTSAYRVNRNWFEDFSASGRITLNYL